MPISAVILTKNEAQNIADCLLSLDGIADEMLVIDSGSTDETCEIAQKHGAIVLQTTWKGYAETKNWGNSQAKFPYILSIDADERLSSELATSILTVKQKLQGVYTCARLSNFCGKWIRHGGWYPDTKIRLFPKACQWKGMLHEQLVVPEGLTKNHLNGDLLHYTTDTIQAHLETINRYTSIAAEEKHKKGKKPKLLKLIFGPMYRFIDMYVFKMGMRDGFYGYMLSVNSAYAVMLREFKLWELNKRS